MIEILVIVPAEELYEAFNNEINRISINGVLFTTTYAYGTEESKLTMVKSYDIVVVRGMTGKAVSQLYPEVTRVDIAMSSADVLEALVKIKRNYNNVKVGLVLSDISICPIDAIK